MKYTIISCSPQNEKRSSSTCIAHIFQKVIEKEESNQASLFSISNKNTWCEGRNSFYESDMTVFVIPVYVENVPGFFLEFLSTLEPRENLGKIAFIIQGGFEEASQLRTTEMFLEKLPQRLNCEYKGTLIRGGMFGMATMRGTKFRQRMEQEFERAAERFLVKNEFDKQLQTEFAGNEYYAKTMIVLAKISKPLNFMAWNIIAKKMGTNGKLADKPYSI